MITASIKTVAHVPGSVSLILDREPVAIRTCARLRWRAHSGITKRTTPPAILSVAGHSFGNVIAAILPWRREARSLRRILSRVASRFGPNLFRRFTAAGTCFSFLRSLLKFFQEPRSGVTYALNLAPAFLSVPAVHVTNMAQERSENAEIKAGNIRNVVR
jgi:hypothetical protein